MKALKKIFFSFLTVILILATLSNCAEDSSVKDSDLKLSLQSRVKPTTISSSIKVKATTDSISSIFFKMGVNQILVSNDSVASTYTFDSRTFFGFMGDEEDLESHTFKVEENKIYDVRHPDTFLTINNAQLELNSPSYTGIISSYADFRNDTTTVRLFIVYNELIGTFTPTMPVAGHIREFATPGAGCDLMNTYYVFGIGFTRAAAEANRIASSSGEINDFTCKKLNTTPDVTNWGGFYTATDTYCCPDCFPRCGGGGSW